ncbi:hypothetical protein NKI39_33980, partial [Mesorhizobium sp. M0664]|uniref:hypothetical protein n=1 Tax=Mesorhizobium sp. M0664 TaxID=2956982 RepID=UPI0033363797
NVTTVPWPLALRAGAVLHPKLFAEPSAHTILDPTSSITWRPKLIPKDPGETWHGMRYPS